MRAFLTDLIWNFPHWSYIYRLFLFGFYRKGSKAKKRKESHAVGLHSSQEPDLATNLSEDKANLHNFSWRGYSLIEVLNLPEMFTKGLTVPEESSEVTVSPYACPLYFSRQDTNNAETFPKGIISFAKASSLLKPFGQKTPTRIIP